MNALVGRQWMFRWGKRAVLRFLPGVPRVWFRGAPLIAWVAGMAAYDLHRPDSRIRAFARRLLENRRSLKQGVEGHSIAGKTIRVLEKRENEEDR